MAKPYEPIAILSISLCVYLGGAPRADAAETWRCGNTYTDQPCAGGKAVDVEDSRSPSAARENDAQTRQAQAAADRMERDRRKQEQIAGRQQPAVIGAKPPSTVPAHPASTPTIGKGKKKKGAKEPEFFTAHDTQAAPIAKKKKSASALTD